MKKYNLTAAVLTCLLSSTAFAGGPAPFYIGGSVGQVNIDNDQSGFDNGNICQGAAKDNQTCTVGDGNSAGHIYGGVQLNETWAVEVGYTDLGNTAGYHYTDPATITQDTAGITVAGVARHRLGKSSPLLAYGKAGVLAWETDVNSVSDNPRIPGGHTNDTGISPIIGAGMEYELNHTISLRAGWDRYYGVGKNDVLVDFGSDSDVGDLNTLDTDVDVYSAGINFSFL